MAKKEVSAFKSVEGREAYLRAYARTVEPWPPHESKYVETSFGSTHVLACNQHGADVPALVMLPGGRASASMWTACIDQLVPHFRVFCVDTIGDTGRGKVERALASISDAITWLDEVIVGLGVGKPLLAGASIGGYMAASFAVEKAERIEGLILLAPAGVFSPPSLKFIYKALRGSLWPTDAAKRQMVVDLSSSIDPRDAAFHEQLFLAGKHGTMLNVGVSPRSFPRAMLQKMEMPTLLVLGERETVGRMTADRVVAKAEELLPRLTARIVPGAAHIFNFQELGRFGEIVVEWTETNRQSK